jgi:hypothetical protein
MKNMWDDRYGKIEFAYGEQNTCHTYKALLACLRPLASAPLYFTAAAPPLAAVLTYRALLAAATYAYFIRQVHFYFFRTFALA